MTCHYCESQSAPGQPLCTACRKALAADLAFCVKAYRPLMDVAAKKASPTPHDAGPTGTRAFAPLPVSAAAWDVFRRMEALALESAAALGVVPKTAQAALLTSRAEAEVLARQSGEPYDAAYWRQAWRDVASATRRILMPAEHKPAPIGGVCRCGGLMALHGRTLACRTCGAVTTTAEDRAVRASGSMTAPQGRATPAEASRVFARAGIRLPAATVRSWMHRGRLEADAEGRIDLTELYRLVAK